MWMKASIYINKFIAEKFNEYGTIDKITDDSDLANFCKDKSTFIKELQKWYQFNV